MVQDLARSASTPLGLCESYAPVLHVGYICPAVGTEVMLDRSWRMSFGCSVWSPPLPAVPFVVLVARQRDASTCPFVLSSIAIDDDLNPTTNGQGRSVMAAKGYW